MNTNTVNTDLPPTISMTRDRYLQVNTLDVMPPSLWHVWMVAAFSTLEKYTSRQEYEEFLKRFSFILSQRVETGVW